MHFYSIDTYQLSLLKSMIIDKLEEQSFNISDLYEAYCLNYFSGNQKLMKEAAKIAFEFAYTDKIFDDIDSYTQPYWKLLRCHSGFIDFLISRYYIYNLREYNNSSQLSNFEMILPKTVTRFIIPQLNASYADEERMVNLCKSKYYAMGIRGKSEMTYWLGRICSPNLADESCDLLKKYYEQLNIDIKKRTNNSNYSLQEKLTIFLFFEGLKMQINYQIILNYRTNKSLQIYLKCL